MPNLSLVFDLMGRDISASKAFRDVGDQAERTGKQAEGVGSRISSGMKVAAAGLIGAGLIEGFKNLYGAAAESERIGRITNSVISSTGGVAKISASGVGDLASALSKKQGIDDEVIQSGSNVLLTFTNIRNEAGRGNDVFNQATAILGDMSTVLGTDISGAAVQVGKALNDPIKGITALSKAGVSFTAQQKDQIRTLVESGQTLDAQRIILGELQKEFGGAAAAAATPLDRLKISAGNLAEQVGGFLVPVVDDFASVADGRLLPALSGVADLAGSVLGPALSGVAAGLGTVADVGLGLLDFFMSLPGPVQVTIGVFGALIAFRGPLADLVNSVKDVGETMALRMLMARDAVGSFGAATATARSGAAGLFGLMGGPWGLAITGVTLGLSLLIPWLQQADNASKQAEESARGYASALEASNGVIDEATLKAAAKAAQDTGLIGVLGDLGLAQGTATQAITQGGSALDTARAALERNMAAHMTRQAVVAADESGTITYVTALDAQGRKSQEALDALNRLSGQTTATTATTAQLTAETGAASTAAQQHQADLEAEAQSASDANTQIGLLKTSLDILTGANITLGDAESAVTLATVSAQKATENLSGAVLENSGQVDRNTEAGARLWDQFTRLGQADNQLIATMIQQGATTDQVTAKDGSLRESFIRTAIQAGLSETAARNLATQILGIPGERTTRINADTGPASAAVNKFVAEVLNTSVSIGFSANAANVQAAFRQLGGAIGGIVHAYAGGGFEPMRGGIAQVVKPNTWRVIGDRIRDDEAYIPIDPTDRRSQRILAQTAHRMGHALVPMDWDPQGLHGIKLAVGGLLRDEFSIPVKATVPDGTALIKKGTEGMFGVGGPANYQAALVFARQQEGKPYIWGGAGPAGYDCSGFMGSITNVIRGKSPYSRIGATGSWPWAGFQIGGNGLFRIGSTYNAFGSGVGHMAGTLLGINVESGSGHGPMVGKRALGADNSLFPSRGALVRDQGGLWPPGWGFNGSAGVERVLNGEQDRYVQRLVDATLAAKQQAGGQLTGRLYLDSGEFLGTVRGMVAGEIDHRDELATVDMRSTR